MFHREGADHHRLSRLVSSAFSPRTIELLRPTVRAEVQGLLEPIVGRGCGDLTSELAKPLAIRTLCHLLGVPADDIEQFQDWASGMGLAFGLLTPETIPIAESAAVGISEYARVLIARRRNRPNDDLVSDLVRSEEEGDRLNTAELVATVASLPVMTPPTARSPWLSYAWGATRLHGRSCSRTRRWPTYLSRSPSACSRSPTPRPVWRSPIRP